MSKKSKGGDIVRSSAAEYLTFIAASGESGIEAVCADESIWVSQKMMAALYDVEVPTINYHLKKVFSDSELDESSVIRKFLTTASDGKQYNTQHYNLAAIIAVGYKVNSERAVQFRKWATRIIEELTIKAYVMDDERIKAGGYLMERSVFEDCKAADLAFLRQRTVQKVAKTFTFGYYVTNKTRQGYARKSILKLAGYSFLGSEK